MFPCSGTVVYVCESLFSFCKTKTHFNKLVEFKVFQTVKDKTHKLGIKKNLMEVETKVFKDGTFYLMYREVGKSADAGQRSDPYTLQCKGKNTVII